MMQDLTEQDLKFISAGMSGSNASLNDEDSLSKRKGDFVMEVTGGALLGFLFIGTPLAVLAGRTEQYRSYVFTPALIGALAVSLLKPLFFPNKK